MQNSATDKFLPRLTFKKLLIMKMLCLFILAASLQVHARVTAQTVTYAARNAKIEDVFKEIKRQTGYGFIYNSRLIESAKPVTIEVDNKALKEVLDVCFKDQPFTYEINNKTVVVKEKAEASKSTGALTTPLPAPGVDVHGRVTDSVGNPLVGASVKVKGVSGRGAVTDENGEFWVKQVDNNAVLVIEFVGYGSGEYAVAGRTEIPATLRMTNKELAEVAIQSYSSGYQTIPKERVAGSFTFLNKELINRRVSPDILSRIDGIAAGVLFTNNASTANATTDLTIRGRSTLFSNASPLIILDNFPYDGDINSINPNDIENITLLKDASAASIWGVQSGNGVIVLTTKKGRRNKPLQVEFNTNFTVGEKPDIYYKRDFMGSSDFIEVEKSLFNQGYYDAKITDPNHTVYSPVVQILADQRAGRITAADANTRIEALKRNDVRDEFSKYYYQPRLLQQYAVNISGGSDKAEYYMSAGYDQDKSNLVLNKSHRVTLKTSETFYLLKNLSVSTDLLYSQTGGVNNNTISDVTTDGSYVGLYPYAQFRDGQGNNLSIPKSYSAVWVNDPSAQVGRISYRYVPLDELGRVNNQSDARDIKLNLGIKYSFLKLFSFDAKYQYEYANSRSENYYSDSSYYSRSLYNRFYNPSGAVVAPVPKGGIYQYGNNFIYSHRARVGLGFNKYFKHDHSVVGLIGAEISQIKSSAESPNTFYGYNDLTKSFTPVDFLSNYPNFPSGSGNIPTIQGYSQGMNRYISYFTNASYTFKKMYDFTASVRIDKSNLFGVNTNQKSVPLYSLGAGWNISNESFYRFLLLPYLKLRATYGYNGNVNTGVTAVPTIGIASNYFLFPSSYAQLRTVSNPLLRWERIRVMNLGIDFASNRDIISGSIEFYQKKGLDIFGTTPLAPSTGTTAFLGNTANINGHGFEISLKIVPVKTKLFEWISNVLLTNEISTVSKYLQKATAASLLTANGYSISPIEGKPVYGIWSYRSGPLNNTGDPQGYVSGKLSSDYTSIIGKATPDSLVFNGSARPTIYGAWRNSISIKRLSISLNIVYKLNYYFRRTSISYDALYSSWIQNADYSNRWQKPGDEQNTNVPSMPSISLLNGNRESFYRLSDKLVDKGDHIRLQDITVSYDVNTSKFANRIIKHLQLYSYINNLGILWRANNDKLDPDVASIGIPNPRTYAVGIRATF